MSTNQSFKSADVLITGGAGFIGSTLAHALVKKGAKVTILDSFIFPYGGNEFNIAQIRKKINLIKGDIRSKRLVRNIVGGKDFVFHLAGQTGRVISMKKPKLDYAMNCEGTLNILDALKKNREAKLIFAGSRGVIGKPHYLPVDENHPTRPRDIYGIHKLTAENYCYIYSHEYDISITVLRLNNIYGPRCQIKSNHYGTINLFISYALQKVKLPIYGDGKQIRDYVYIDDVVGAFLLSMSKAASGEVFFVSSGIGRSLLEIAKIIKKNIPGASYEFVPYPKSFGKFDFPKFIGSYEKIQKKLQWKPTVSLENGIKKTILYYKKYLKYYL